MMREEHSSRVEVLDFAQEPPKQGVLGVMEPRPMESVGWGISEVLWGGRQ